MRLIRARLHHFRYPVARIKHLLHQLVYLYEESYHDIKDFLIRRDQISKVTTVHSDDVDRSTDSLETELERLNFSRNSLEKDRKLAPCSSFCLLVHSWLACEYTRISGCHWFRRRQATAGRKYVCVRRLTAGRRAPALFFDLCLTGL